MILSKEENGSISIRELGVNRQLTDDRSTPSQSVRIENIGKLEKTFCIGGEELRESHGSRPSLSGMRSYFSNIIIERRISWNEALIYTTCFSYLTATLFSINGYPAIRIDFIPTYVQALFYLVMPILLILSRRYRPLRWSLSGLYGFLAITSFSGIQPWVTYSGDSSFLGPMMALWDLALGVSLKLDSKN